MTGKIHIWMLVLVGLAHLLDASRIERQVPNKTVDKQIQPTSSRMTEEELNKVCGASKSSTTQHDGHAVLGQFPWMAAIFLNKKYAYVSCGGALISEQYVLTAASCVIYWETGQKMNVTDFTVRLGDLDIATDTDKADPLDCKVVELIPHKDYKLNSGNDIALIKLEKAVQFSDRIAPICLPTSSQMTLDGSNDKKPMVGGWGTVDFQTQPSHVLQFDEVDLVPNSECQKQINLTHYNVSDSELCAVQHLGRKVVCEGDGGGPLMLLSPKNSRWYTIGVTSKSIECGKYPEIYTRTTYYLDWIMKAANINRKST